MREELLAHLTGALEEEMARGADEEAAIEQALCSHLFSHFTPPVLAAF